MSKETDNLEGRSTMRLPDRMELRACFETAQGAIQVFHTLGEAQAQRVDANDGPIFWTLYVQNDEGLPMAVGDFKTRDAALECVAWLRTAFDQTLGATIPRDVTQSYLERFPPDQRATADRAYRDGFEDGVNSTEESNDATQD